MSTQTFKQSQLGKSKNALEYPTLRSGSEDKKFVDILSNILEPIRAGVPHRLPLPPLLTSPLPNSNAININGSTPVTQRSALRPAKRRMLLPCIGYTAPLSESNMNDLGLLQTKSSLPMTAVNEYGSTSINKTKEEINSLCRLQNGPRPLNASVLSDLRILAASSQRAGKPLAEALCRWNLAVEYESAGKHLDALKSYNSYLQPCIRAGYSPGVVAGLSGMGAQLYILAGFTAIGETSQENMILDSTVNNEVDLNNNKNEETPEEIRKHRLTSAIAFYEKALSTIPSAIKLVESTTGGWVSKSIAITSILNNIGLCFIALGDYYAASGAFKKALQYALLVPKRSYERAICANQATVDAYFGNFERAKDGIERHIAMFCSEENQTGCYTNTLEKSPMVMSLTSTDKIVDNGKLIDTNTKNEIDRDIKLDDPIETNALRTETTAAYATEIGAVLANMGALARMHGDIENSKEFYSRAYNLSVRTGDEKHSVVSACALGAVCGEEIAANNTSTAVSEWLKKQKSNGNINEITVEGYEPATDDEKLINWMD